MARLETLPNEILYAIASCITADCVTQRVYQRRAKRGIERTLAALSLLNRHFHQIFDLRLYRWNRDCGQRALNWAIQKQSFPTIEKALAAGFDLNRASVARIPPLMVKRYAWRENMRPIEVAIKSERNDVLKWLLEHGASPDYGRILHVSRDDGTTSHRASDVKTSALYLVLHETQNEEAARLLLDHGALVYFAELTRRESRFEPRTTALHVAAGAGMAGVVEKLLRMEDAIRLDHKDRDHQTALTHCAQKPSSQKAVIDIFLRHGAHPTRMTTGMDDPLCNALYHGHMDNVLALIQAVADASSSDADFTPWSYVALTQYIMALDSRATENQCSGPFAPDKEIQTILAKFLEVGADFNNPPPPYQYPDESDSDSDIDSDEPPDGKFFRRPSVTRTRPCLPNCWR